MSNPVAEKFAFGVWLLDPAERTLTRGYATQKLGGAEAHSRIKPETGSQSVSLPLRTCQILQVLLERAGQVVSKRAVREYCGFPRGADELNLNAPIAALSELLGERDGGGPFIELLGVRGYRFAEPVHRLGSGEHTPESPASFRDTRALTPLAFQPRRSRSGGLKRPKRYQFLSLLGAGGMGEVYLARDTQLDRQVALKLLARKYTDNPDWLRRFVREAKAASVLNHPNIITIHEIGEVDGVHYIATEYIEGKTLRVQMLTGPMSPLLALGIAVQVAGALSAAHGAGIIHRDIKPENIMIRPDGYVKLLDFGLAKPLNATASRLSLPHTDPGTVMGTTHYMSPEQARGLSVDARSDVFSLGVLIYEMLAGRAPFSGKTGSDVLVAILDRPYPPLSSLLPDPPAELERIIGKALRKDREQRYQTVKDLHLDLKSLQQELELRSRFGESWQREAPAEKPQAERAAPNSQRSGGYRPVSAGFSGSNEAGLEIPEVHYARSGEINIAYQVIGDAPMDLVFVMGWISHLEYFWTEPSFARFLRRLAGFARVILFDKRGTGLSDRVPLDQLPTLEQRMDDVRAVMDAVHSQRAVLCGVSEGGPMCSLFAATYPEKTIALVMIGSYARRLQGEGYPWGPTEAQRDHFLEEIRNHWGGPVGLEDRAPSMASDPAFRTWWAAYLRRGASPGAAVALTRMNTEIDIRHVLPTVRVPTLVVHRSGDLCLKVEEGRYLAENIPGAKFVELPGIDHLPFVGAQDEILDEIEEFLTGVRHASEFDRVLATVLIVRLAASEPELDSTDSLSRHQLFFRKEVELFKGRLVSIQRELLLATFDGPARAIRAAGAICASGRRLGVSLRAGLHTGECDVRADLVAGPAVEIASRIANEAGLNEVLVSSTVKDLVAGSGIQFVERGWFVLDEDLGEWRLFAV